MGQEGDVQRGGFRLDGSVTSRDKVDRRLCVRGLRLYDIFGNEEILSDD
ncbi:hypothetical protein ALC62_01834 [Cyphomyrmex costatus]|uniref:Uncharacterized protein n=1 Tax=Cyphomyrmex costatus TaxID=456900 RepID=A0A151IP98_9HYME|nr:hypothetical protein ALC62_01834 [Cyphomyrmex costatus]